MLRLPPVRSVVHHCLQSQSSPRRSLSKWSCWLESATPGAPADTARNRSDFLLALACCIDPMCSTRSLNSRYTVFFQPFCDGAHKSKAQGLSPLRFFPDKDATVWLCGCKHTHNPPYCDGTHKQAVIVSAPLHQPSEP